MEEVWAHDDGVECVHPRWDLLLGWDEVRERWARIFANTKRARVALSNVWVRVEGEVAWAACTAHVTTAFAEGFDEAIVQATNIFVQREGQWLLAGSSCISRANDFSSIGAVRNGAARCRVPEFANGRDGWAEFRTRLGALGDGDRLSYPRTRCVRVTMPHPFNSCLA